MILVPAAALLIALLPAHEFVPRESSWPAATPVLELRLERSVRTAAGPTVALREVVSVVADAEGAWLHLADVRVPIGDRDEITRATVRRRLVSAGVPRAALRLIGPSIVDVERSSL